MKYFFFLIGLLLTIQVLEAQTQSGDRSPDLISRLETTYPTPNHYLVTPATDPIEMKFTISGIYTQGKMQTIKADLKHLLHATNDLVALTSLAINIESSGKIAVKPLGKLDEAIIENIREYLDLYDWDYLHEIMTVDILIRIDKEV